MCCYKLMYRCTPWIPHDSNFTQNRGSLPKKSNLHSRYSWATHAHKQWIWARWFSNISFCFKRVWGIYSCVSTPPNFHTPKSVKEYDFQPHPKMNNMIMILLRNQESMSCTLSVMPEAILSQLGQLRGSRMPCEKSLCCVRGRQVALFGKTCGPEFLYKRRHFKAGINILLSNSRHLPVGETPYKEVLSEKSCGSETIRHWSEKCRIHVARNTSSNKMQQSNHWTNCSRLKFVHGSKAKLIMSPLKSLLVLL